MTNDLDLRASLGPTVRTMQIIVFALSMGVVMFGGFVCLSGRVTVGDFSMHGMFSWAALGMGVVGLVLSSLVPRLMPIAGNITDDIVANADHDGLVRNVVGGLQTKMIVGLAICEGAAFANLLALMNEGSTPNLVMAAVLLAAMLARLPTVDSVVARIENLAQDSREKARWK